MSLEFTFSCPLPNGLHARPASQIADVAKGFASNCTLRNARNGRTANAKSVLAIIAANVSLDDVCRFEVSGVDEVAACSAIREFIEQVLPGCDELLKAAVNDSPKVLLPRSLRGVVTNWYSGLCASRGIGQGQVVLMGGMNLPSELLKETSLGPGVEQEKLDLAIASVRARIDTAVARAVPATEMAILKAHSAIVGDVAFSEKLARLITLGKSAGEAVIEAGEFFIAPLKNAESLYVRERAVDMQDICIELLEQLYGPKFQPAMVELTCPSVVVAESLAPRQLLALGQKWLKALVLGSAGTTSHAVILARSLGIPTLVGVKDSRIVLSPGQEVVVDANRGFVVAEWTAPVQRFYEREWGTLGRRQAALARYAQATAKTADGSRLEVAANVSSAEELMTVFEKGAEGIGLFRTEMLFMGRDRAPSEEEQFTIYVQAVGTAAGRAVVVRTLDVGGDKPLPYLNLPQETNPFLGYRGVRIYAEHQELLRAQLRAIIRASAFGRIQVIAPMISSLTEVRWLKARIVEIQSELKALNIAFDSAMRIGIMIEIPSVAFILDQLCREVDFFSVGTNDLCQYFLAVDRDNPKVAGLSGSGHPSFIRLLKQIVDEVHKGGKWVGVCGEMAGDIRHLPLFIGMGLDEISVAASEIPALKAAISSLSVSDCRQILEQAVACRSVEEVDALLKQARRHGSSHPLLDQELVIIDGEDETKGEAIREIVDAFYVAGRTDHPEQVEEALWAREAVYSTGLGYGFAIPHCKTDAVTASSIGILKLKQPVEWGSLDGEPVRMVILLAMRESDANATHMQVFSRLSRKLMHEEFRDRLLRATDATTLLAHLAEDLDIRA